MPVTRIIDAEETIGPRLFTRAEALKILRIGETTLYWLQRTGKLNVTHIGSRVLFHPFEIERIASQGASLTEAEKEAAAKRDREIAKGYSQLGKSETPSGGEREDVRLRGRRKRGIETSGADP